MTARRIATVKRYNPGYYNPFGVMSTKDFLFTQVVAVFEAEIVNYGKTIEKLKTKNRVTKDQKDKFLQKIKMNLSTSEVKLSVTKGRRFL